MRNEATRRENLKALVMQRGGPGPLSKALGGKPSAIYISHMTSQPARRPVTEKTARGIEKKLGLRTGSLDEPELGGVKDAPISVDTELVSAAMIATLTALQEADLELQPAKFSDLVLLVYREAKRNSGRIDVEHLRQLIRLAKE